LGGWSSLALFGGWGYPTPLDDLLEATTSSNKTIVSESRLPLKQENSPSEIRMSAPAH
jgi:hypothetical protein